MTEQNIPKGKTVQHFGARNTVSFDKSRIKLLSAPQA